MADGSALAAWVPIVVAAVALVVSGITAWATWIAPVNAAKLAEDLRTGSAKAERNENMKMLVFATLMQERATPYTAEAAKMFNLIDVIFQKSDAVREAWKQYFWTLDTNNHASYEKQISCFYALLLEMANDIGLSTIKTSDISRTYAPGYLVRKMNIETMQMDFTENSLKEANMKATANTSPHTAT